MNDSSSTNETFIPRWFNSELPYFVIIRDHSNYVIDNENTGRNKSSTPESDNDASPSPSAPVLKTSTGLIYPEVHYVFSDDDFVPTVDVLNMQESDEVSIVVDFDQQGEHIIGCNSFTSNWQVTNAAMLQKSEVNWSKAGDNELWTSVLTIDGTNVEMKVDQQMTVNDLIGVVQARNRQLEEVWKNCKEKDTG